MTHFSELQDRVLIVTALPVEFNAVLRHLHDVRNVNHPRGDIYVVGRFMAWNVLVAETGAGNIAAAQATERAITYADPDLAIFVGVAGGLKDVRLTDVVVSTRVLAYEYGADRDTFQARSFGLSPSYPLVQQARAVARGDAWKLRIEQGANVLAATPSAFLGPIAAGEKVVKSSRGHVASLLRQNYGDALAVEMEGAGFLYATHAASIDAILVRGISDLLDGKEMADAAGSQLIAAAHAAAFAFELLCNLSTRSRTEVVEQALADSDHGHFGEDIWTTVREFIPRFYPMGPTEKEVWSDAGGDLAALDLSGDGRTQWARAVRLLERGGGGRTINLVELLRRMSRDFPRNLELAYLIDRVARSQ